MDLHNSFTVPCPVDEAWEVLTDVERIAPCMPGAQLTGIEGDEFQGTVKVKVGPITANYKGTASFVERDDAVHRAVLRAKGRDSRGAGTAEALVTATLSAVTPDETRVEVDTDLKVSGKVAQFGRGVMADVSAKLMDQFAGNLADLLAEGSEDATDGAAEEAASAAPNPEPAPVDLLDTAGMPVLRRVGPVVGALVLLLILRRLCRRR